MSQLPCLPAAPTARRAIAPLLSALVAQEQTRAFIEHVILKPQRVAPLTQSSKKGPAAAGGAGGTAPPLTSGLGAKEAATKEAAAKLPKLKKADASSKAGGGSTGTWRQHHAGQEMAVIKEASRKGSTAAVCG